MHALSGMMLTLMEVSSRNSFLSASEVETEHSPAVETSSPGPRNLDREGKQFSILVDGWGNTTFPGKIYQEPKKRV